MKKRNSRPEGVSGEPGSVGAGEAEARRIVRRAAIASALAGASPVPLGGIAGVPAIQAKMLVELAKAHGRSMELREARNLASFLGGATALQYLVRLLTRTAAARLPAIGTAAGAASGFGSTFALGLVAIRYFRHGPEKGAPDARVVGFEREAQALRLEWESGAISEEVYRRDLDALREKVLSTRPDPVGGTPE